MVSGDSGYESAQRNTRKGNAVISDRVLQRMLIREASSFIYPASEGPPPGRASASPCRKAHADFEISPCLRIRASRVVNRQLISATASIAWHSNVPPDRGYSRKGHKDERANDMTWTGPTDGPAVGASGASWQGWLTRGCRFSNN